MQFAARIFTLCIALVEMLVLRQISGPWKTHRKISVADFRYRLTTCAFSYFWIVYGSSLFYSLYHQPEQITERLLYSFGSPLGMPTSTRHIHRQIKWSDASHSFLLTIPTLTYALAIHPCHNDASRASGTSDCPGYPYSDGPSKLATASAFANAGLLLPLECRA